MAVDRVEPIGERRLDYLFAHLAYNVYHALMASRGKEMKSKTLEDFLIHWGEGSNPEEEAETQHEDLREKILKGLGLKT